jgi:sugar lactone lactonase YvrE
MQSAAVGHGTPAAALLILNTSLTVRYRWILMTEIHSRRSVQAFALVFGALLLAAGMIPASADEDSVAAQAMFFPPPPDIPRLQFLQRYSSPLDVTTKKQGFRDFVFGGEQDETKLVEKPYGLALYDGAIFVVDTRSNGYGIFDIANGRSRVVKPTGPGALAKPINITIGEDGTRYITDTDREQIVVLDSRDRFVRAIGNPGQFKPVDVAIDGNKLYVTDIMHHRIVVIDRLSGDELFEFGNAGSDPGQLFHPTNLAVGSDGTIYVTDTSNFRVQQFEADGTFIREIGALGTTFGHFARPKGITLDEDDNIYVVDAAFQNIQILAPDGAPLMAFGGPGPDKWNVSMPTVVKVDYENVRYFEKFAAPDFEIEYLVLVASQYGQNKVVVFGFGHFEE